MRRLALVLTLLALPVAAWASQPKVAVFTDSRSAAVGVPTDSTWRRVGSLLLLLEKLGVPYEMFDAGDSSSWRVRYGGAAKGDSTAFRENFSAILIPDVERPDSNASSWQLFFKDSNGTVGVDKSPLSGKWSIPVYVGTRNLLYAKTDFRPGVAGTVAWGRSHGTWGGRMTSRLRGVTGGDSLFAQAPICACREATMGDSSGTGGNTALAAIATIDTTYTGICHAGDTLVTVWRYRPVAGKPGIMWSLVNADLPKPGATFLNLGDSSSPWGTSTGHLFLLEALFQETPVRPMQRIYVQTTQDHTNTWPDSTYSSPFTRTVAHYRSMEDAGLYTWSGVLSSPCELESLYVHNTQMPAGVPAWLSSEYVRLLTNGRMRWAPHGHQTNCQGYGWTFATYTAAADTAKARYTFWRQMNMAAQTDTAGLPVAARNIYFIGPPNNAISKWTAPLLYTAGMRVMRGFGPNASTTNLAKDPYFISGYADPAPVNIRGTNGVAWVKGQSSLFANLTYWADGGYEGGNTWWELPAYDYMPLFEASLWWRWDVWWDGVATDVAGNNTTSGTTGGPLGSYQDNWFPWLMRGAVKNWFLSFSHVIAPDKWTVQVKTSRRTFTSATAAEPSKSWTARP